MTADEAELDTDASALMDGGDDAGGDQLATEPTDPAKTENAYLTRMREAAVRENGDDPAAAEWGQNTDADRTRAVLNRADDGATEDGEDSDQPEAASDPEAVDWEAFAREFNFHLAGQGRQNRHTNKTKLRIALETSDHVATNTPDAFLADAVACDAVPLVKDESLGYLFAEEVLSDE